MNDLPAVEMAVSGTQPEYHFPPYVSSIARSPRMPPVVFIRVHQNRNPKHSAKKPNGLPPWISFDR